MKTFTELREELDEANFKVDDKKLELGNAAGSGDIRLYSNSSNGNTYLESYSGSFTLENETNNTLYINSSCNNLECSRR